MHQENKDKGKPAFMDTIKNEFDTARRKDEIYRETVKWMETDPHVQEYLKQFQPYSLEKAISSYAWRKAGWIVKKEANEWLLEEKTLKYKNAAEHCLANIQQKKLFDFQCRWRAREMEHPAIQSTHDFMYWEYNVLNCPFLDPITQEDVDLYIDYINEHLGKDLPFLGSWQDYNTYNSSFATIGKIMNKGVEETEEEEDIEEEEGYDEEGEEGYEDSGDDDEMGNLMPAWYVFWNTHRGDSHLLLLPDLRQEKEWFYNELAQKELREKTIEKFKENPPDRRPAFDLYDEENLLEFIEDFEKDSKEILSAYDAQQKLSVDEDEEGDMYLVEEAWYELIDCYEPFPIAEGITDWKEALVVTAQQWKNTKIARLIPIVYEEYLFRMQTGIEHPYDKKKAEGYREMADMFKGHILRGRELNGEPRDFNF